MTFDKKRGLRTAILATAVAGAVLGVASLPASARGFVSFGFGAPAYYGGPTYYQPYYGGYAYAPPPPAYYYPPPPAPVYAAPAINFGVRVR